MAEELPSSVIAAGQRLGLIDKNRGQGQLLAGDGSSRRFYRLQAATVDCVAVTPSAGVSFAGPDQGLAEARAAWLIGRHLRARGVPVPEIYGFDEESGIIFFEDLGDTLLHDRIISGALAAGELPGLYRQAVAILAHMQVAGRQGFYPGWCWDTPRYDQRLMLERESLYFEAAFCRDYLGMETAPPDLLEEFARLAARAGQAPAGYFLHRDYQCRNLMVHQDHIRIIDFQGGRLGPLAYDLAALLIDPYAGLSLGLQEELQDCYLSLLAANGVDCQGFASAYFYLALQRNLQILGAFAFLSRVKGKGFFAQYLRPALATLNAQLAKPAGSDYPCLRRRAAQCARLLKG